MKLLSIRLKNVRQFTQRVRVENLSDGLNVLSEPNEHGKSTLFDALQAMFFKLHTARDKDTRGLQPHAGGAPEIEVEIETKDGRFWLSKRWLSKPFAKIEQEGRLIAQADAAESWIKDLFAGGAGGPSGLLWVRQGITALSAGTKPEQSAALSARRDLLSSVTGEVEAVTGGRRMDAALQRCRTELSTLLTDGGRPKAGGDLKIAQDQVTDLSEQRDTLKVAVDQLRETLKRRRKLRRDLSNWEDAEAAKERNAKLIEAEALFEAAKNKAQSLEAEDRKLEAARLRVTNLRSQLERLRETTAETNKALEAVTLTQNTLERASTDRDAARALTDQARNAVDAAQTKLDALKDRRHKATVLEAARSGAKRRENLLEHLQQSETLRNEIEILRIRAKTGPGQEELSRLEQLNLASITERAKLHNDAPQLRMNYIDGAEGSISRDGAPIEGDVDYSIPSGAQLTLKAIGTLTIRPGVHQVDEAELEAAEMAFRVALDELGVTDLAAARRAAEKRQEANLSLKAKTEAFKILAPNGLDGLHAAIAQIPEPQDQGGDVEDMDALEEEITQAESALTEARAKHGAATEKLSAEGETFAKAQASLHAANERLVRAENTAKKFVDLDEDVLEADLKLDGERLAASEALQAEARRNTPSLEVAQSRLERARSVVASAEQAIADLKPEIATLDERVKRHAGDAVEERLAETVESLERAEAELQRQLDTVATLQKLEAVLVNARSDARDRYFAPVAEELRPLLQILWHDAELYWEDKTLLPTRLIRNGQEEDIDVLSGGTQEQIALLVRLAFARILTKTGQHAPIILDDALVFTDDDRIERMFDALHAQASDLQIIVLSCRQRAFRDLGGTRLRLETSVDEETVLAEVD